MTFRGFCNKISLVYGVIHESICFVKGQNNNSTRCKRERKEFGIMAEEKKTATVKPIAKAAVKAEAAKEEKKEAVAAPAKKEEKKAAAAAKKEVKKEVKEAKKEAKKEAVQKVAATKVVAKKAATVKKAAVKTAVVAKKAEKVQAKKAAVKKAVAPKKAAAPKCSVYVQWNEKSYNYDDLVKIAKDVWVYDLKQKESDFKTVDIYVKPFENVAYYVINGTENGSFAI